MVIRRARSGPANHHISLVCMPRCRGSVHIDSPTVNRMSKPHGYHLYPCGLLIRLTVGLSRRPAVVFEGLTRSAQTQTEIQVVSMWFTHPVDRRTIQAPCRFVRGTYEKRSNSRRTINLSPRILPSVCARSPLWTIRRRHRRIEQYTSPCRRRQGDVYCWHGS